MNSALFSKNVLQSIRARTTTRLALYALLVAAGLVSMLAGQGSARAQGGAGEVVVVKLDRAIDAVSARYLARALRTADEDGAALVVIELDTPGGSLDSTRDMVTSILTSTVPVAVYVAPSGAHAASAGTFIAASAAVLAMAPATNIGAAAVVGIEGEDLPDTIAKKATEDAAAFLRDIATQRGRPVGLLEATVLEAKAYSASEAVTLGIADLSAPTLADLLRQLHGRTVKTALGEATLDLTGAPLRDTTMTFLDRVLAFLANPTLSFLLMSLGGLGIVVELWSPGLIVPGALGVIFLILGFAGLGQLPFSWAGIALFVVAMGLIFAETQSPGFGFLGVAGAVCLVLAGVFIVGGIGDPAVPGPSFRVSRWVLVGIGVGALAVTALFVREIRLSRKAGPYSSPYAASRLVGQTAEVVMSLSPEGQVRLEGEVWSAETASGQNVPAGQKVKVTATRDITLIVEPVQRAEG